MALIIDKVILPTFEEKVFLMVGTDGETEVYTDGLLRNIVKAVEVVPVEHGKVYPPNAKFWVEASTKKPSPPRGGIPTFADMDDKGSIA